MTALGRTIPPEPGEPPHAFVSRLARLFGLSAQDFCSDMCLSVRGLADGRPDVLAKLAELASCDPRDLGGHAFERDGDVLRLRGQVVDKAVSRRVRLHVCPACLADDMRASTLPPDQAAYVRAEWLIDTIRTCPRHGRALVDIDDGSHLAGLRAYDYSARLAPYLPDLASLAATARPRPASPLECYLVRRIEEGGPAGSDWLDGLAFHAAARICEVIGAVALYGRSPNLNDLGENDWWAAGDAGFVVADGGPDGVRSFLSHLQETYEHLGPEGPQAVFGRLYQYLAFAARSAAFDPVRALVAGHVVETMPVAPGETVLGRVVERRVVHSLASAAAETGCHPKRLKKLLSEAGFIPPGSVNDRVVTFRAEGAADFLASVTENLGLAEAGAYLNAPRVQMQLIADHGLVRPIVDRRKGHMRAFARSELDAFLRRLTQGAKPDAQVGGSVGDLPTAAHQAHFSVVEIVRMIIDGRLSYVGRRPDVAGYMSVLVDVDEIKRLSRGADVNGLLPMHVIREVGLNYQTVNALLANGALPSHRAAHPVKRYEVTVVTRHDLDEFRRTYATLFHLSRETGWHHLHLKERLAASGVHPCFPPEELHCSLYRRREVLACGELGPPPRGRRGQTMGGPGLESGQTSGAIMDRLPGQKP